VPFQDAGYVGYRRSCPQPTVAYVLVPGCSLLRWLPYPPRIASTKPLGLKVRRCETQFKPGDKVFGSCRGAFAEFVCTSESALVMTPDNVTFEQAASVLVAAFTTLWGLRDKGQIQPGHKVLINGAAGGVRTLAVQIAKSTKPSNAHIQLSRRLQRLARY
jgi:NADPH:quinone reductase-like Zn-dependent oxidoreductase